MPAIMKILAVSLAAAMFGTALTAVPAFADSTTRGSTPAVVAPPTDRQVKVAIDALRDVIGAMVDRGAMTAAQRDAVVDAAKAADWDGFSIERLGDILQDLVERNAITARQRAAIIDGMKR